MNTYDRQQRKANRREVLLKAALAAQGQSLARGIQNRLVSGPIRLEMRRDLFEVEQMMQELERTGKIETKGMD
jgi:hypothetical protein